MEEPPDSSSTPGSTCADMNVPAKTNTPLSTATAVLVASTRAGASTKTATMTKTSPSVPDEPPTSQQEPRSTRLPRAPMGHNQTMLNDMEAFLMGQDAQELENEVRGGEDDEAAVSMGSREQSVKKKVVEKVDKKVQKPAKAGEEKAKDPLKKKDPLASLEDKKIKDPNPSSDDGHKKSGRQQPRKSTDEKKGRGSMDKKKHSKQLPRVSKSNDGKTSKTQNSVQNKRFASPTSRKLASKEKNKDNEKKSREKTRESPKGTKKAQGRCSHQ